MPRPPSILSQHAERNGCTNVKLAAKEKANGTLKKSPAYSRLSLNDETAASSRITIRRRREIVPPSAHFTPPLPTSSNGNQRPAARRERFSVLISMQFSIEERVEMEMRIQALKGDVVHDWHKASKITHVIVKLNEQLTFSSGNQNVCVRCSEYFIGIVNRSIIVSDKWLAENLHRSSFVDTKPYEVVGEDGSETCMFSYAPNAVRKGLVSPLENYTFFMAREFIPESNVGYMQYDLLRYVTRRSAAKVVENVPDLVKLLNDIRSSPASLKDEASAAAGRKSTSFATPAKPQVNNDVAETQGGDDISQTVHQQPDTVEDDDIVHVASSLSLNLPTKVALQLTPSFAATKLSSSARKSTLTTGSGTTTTSSTARARQGGDQKVFLLAGGCLQNYAVSDDYKKLAKRLNVRIVCCCYIWDSISTWTKTGFWNYVLYGDIFGACVDRKVHHISPSFLKYNRTLCLLNSTPPTPSSACSCCTASTTSSLTFDSAAGSKPPTLNRQLSSDVSHASSKVKAMVNGTAPAGLKKHAFATAADFMPNSSRARPNLPAVDAPPAPPLLLPPEEENYFFSDLIEDVRQTRDTEYKQQMKKRRHVYSNSASILLPPSNLAADDSNNMKLTFDSKLSVYDRYHIPPPLQRRLPKHLYRNEYFVPGYDSSSKWMEVPRNWAYMTIADAKKVADKAKYGSILTTETNVVPSRPTAAVTASVGSNRKTAKPAAATKAAGFTPTPISRMATASPPPQIIAVVTPPKKTDSVASAVAPTTSTVMSTADDVVIEKRSEQTVVKQETDVVVRSKPIALVAATTRPRRSYRGPVGLDAVDVAVVATKKKLTPVAPASSPDSGGGAELQARKRARLMT